MTAPLRPPEPALLLVLQLLAAGVAVGLGVGTGLGARAWPAAAAILLTAAAFAWWRRHRGSGPLGLAAVRRLCGASAAGLGLALAAGNLALWGAAAEPGARVAIAVGTALAGGFTAGVLTLCGLSLGLGADQPVTAILPDPAHPSRGRRAP